MRTFLHAYEHMYVCTHVCVCMYVDRSSNWRLN